MKSFALRTNIFQKIAIIKLLKLKNKHNEETIYVHVSINNKYLVIFMS